MTPFSELAPPIEAPREPFWGYLDLLLFAGLAVPSMLVGFAAVKGPIAILHWRPPARVFELLPEQLLGYLILFFGLRLLFRVEYDRPFWRSLGWTESGRPVIWIVSWGAVAAILVTLASALLGPPAKPTPMMDLMESRTAIILMACFGVTAAPLFEELGFRGFLQPLLVRSVGPVAGVLLTAIPFGLLHFEEYGNSWRYVAVIALAGAAFGWMKQITGSTKAAAIMHAAYNAFFFLVLFSSGKDWPKQW